MKTAETILRFRKTEWRGPGNFCRAVFLQIARRIIQYDSSETARELSRYFARKAETLLDASLEIDLEKELPEVNREVYGLVLRALEEVTRAIEISDTQPESWNECPTWRDWGIVKSRELLGFWRSLKPVFSGARKS